MHERCSVIHFQFFNAPLSSRRIALQQNAVFAQHIGLNVIMVVFFWVLELIAHKFAFFWAEFRECYAVQPRRENIISVLDVHLKLHLIST
jgi:hypothetical protein